MQSRLRSPGEGVRTNSAAIGLGSGRLSEGSIQGHGVYNSDYRSFNRGFGRGSPKPYPPPPQPPRRGDIFMEAGRLAAEYLVSQGMLPPNSLPNKWQNCKFQDFRGQDRESLPPPSKGRTSVLARLGNLDADAGSGRRRFVDEFGQVGLRNHSRGRRRTGSYRSYGSDWGRENGRTGSWSEKARGLSDSNDTDDDFIGGYRGELRGGFDANAGSRRTSAEKIPSKSENVGSEPDLETNEPHGDADSKEKNSNRMKEHPVETDTDLNEVLDDDGGMPLEAGEVNYSISEDKMEEKIEEMENLDKLTSSVELDKQPASVELDRQMNSMDLDKKPNLLEDDQVSEIDTGLLLKCNFGEVLSNTPFSMTPNVSKVEEYPTNEEKTKSDIGPPRENNASIEGASVEVSSNDPLKNRPPSPKCLTPDISRVRSIQSIYEPGDFDSAFVLERESDKISQSFSNRFSGIHQHESNQESLASGSTSMVTLGEEEGFNLHLASGDVGTKRPREWDKDSDESFHMQNFRVKKSALQVDRVATEEGIVDAIDQGNLDALFSKVRAQPGLDSREEKQLLSGSFKICDLNLMEASEIPESPNDISIPSSTAGVMNEVDVDLSIISKSFNCSDHYAGPSSDPKEILIVDVPDDDDPVMEDKSHITSAGKAETIYSSLGNFLSHTDRNVHIQDSYGLTISEFIETDITSCSTIPADSNHTQGDLTIPNEEVIHGGDDDPIYLSLEEIPIGYMGVWDRPSQEYGRPF